MAKVTDEKIEEVVNILWLNIYEEDFRGKQRGRFAITREQLKSALGTKKLHASTVERLIDAARDLGLVIVDLDSIFACIEVRVLVKLRRPPAILFEKFFPNTVDDDDEGEE